MFMRGLSAFVLVLFVCVAANSQTPTPTPSLDSKFVKDVVKDEKKLLTNSFHPSRGELKWIIPLAVATAAVVATDRHTSAWVSRNGSLASVAHKVSWGGSVFTTFGMAGGMYLIGRSNDNYHLRETGRLGLEALAVNGMTTEALKLAFARSRPNMDNGSGEFWEGGRSFPSGHSSSAWALATIIAHEYKDRKWIKIAAYSAASAVSLSRYAGRNHFLSEVITGSALGYGTGVLVYRLHH